MPTSISYLSQLDLDLLQRKTMALLEIIVPTKNSQGWIGRIDGYYRRLGLDPLYVIDGRSSMAFKLFAISRLRRRLNVTPEQPRVEAMVAAIAERVRARWMLRLDDDEIPSREMINWISAKLATIEAPYVGFPRRWLALEGDEVVFARNPLFGQRGLDHQFRLFQRDAVSFDHGIHTPGFRVDDGDALLAPDECFIAHLDWVLKDYDTRKQKVASYDRQRPDAGSGFTYYYLYEDFPSEEYHFTPLRDPEIVLLTRSLTNRASSKRNPIRWIRPFSSLL